MAVITKLNQDNENQQGGGAQAVTPVGGAQNSSLPSTGQSAMVNNTAAPQVGSGRFTNLQSYVNANKGSGEKIANKIGENVQKAADNTNKAVEATGTVQSQLDAEKNRIAQASGYAQQINTDPTQLAANQQTVDAVTKLRMGTNAADSINNEATSKLNSAMTDLQTLQKNAANTATEAGRFQLLQQALGRPSYNQGQQRLDQLLVQNGGGGVLDALQKNAQTTSQNATKQLGSVASNLNNGIADIQAQSKDASKAINDALGKFDDVSTVDKDGSGALGTLQQQLQARQAEFIAKNQGLVDNINAGKSTGTFNEDALKLLGLQAGQSLYDVNLNDYINPTWSQGNISEQSVATDADLARYQALSKLAGFDPSYLTANQVNTATGATVDPTQLQSTLAQRQAQWNEAATNYQNMAAASAVPASQGGTYGFSQYFSNPDGSQMSPAQTIARIEATMPTVRAYATSSEVDPRFNQSYTQLLNWYNSYKGLNTGRTVGQQMPSGETYTPGKGK